MVTQIGLDVDDNLKLFRFGHDVDKVSVPWVLHMKYNYRYIDQIYCINHSTTLSNPVH